jgi:hypothetical protein
LKSVHLGEDLLENAHLDAPVLKNVHLDADPLAFTGRKPPPRWLVSTPVRKPRGVADGRSDSVLAVIYAVSGRESHQSFYSAAEANGKRPSPWA